VCGRGELRQTSPTTRTTSARRVSLSTATRAQSVNELNDDDDDDVGKATLRACSQRASDKPSMSIDSTSRDACSDAGRRSQTASDATMPVTPAPRLPRPLQTRLPSPLEYWFHFRRKSRDHDDSKLKVNQSLVPRCHSSAPPLDHFVHPTHPITAHLTAHH